MALSEEQRKDIEAAVAAYQKRYKGCVFIPTIGELIAEGFLNSDLQVQ